MKSWRGVSGRDGSGRGVTGCGWIAGVASALAWVAGPAAGQELLTNPGFDDTDLDGSFGDGWIAFGAAGFENFFGASGPGHAVLFADLVFNDGGIFQAGIPASGGTVYAFRCAVNAETNFDAVAEILLEFYADDEATLLGERAEVLFLRPGQGYDRVELVAEAPAGAAFVRPVVRFSQVGTGGPMRAALVDDASLTVRGVDTNRVANGGFLDLDQNFTPGDGWDTFGAAGLNDFFGAGNPGHATLFADRLGNSGGVFQLRRGGRPGVTYEFSADIQFEPNWDAPARIAIEYWGIGDGQPGSGAKLGESVAALPGDAAGAGYRRYAVTGTAPAGTVYVRPLIAFDPPLTEGVSRAATIDNTLLTVADENLIRNPSFEDPFVAGAWGGVWSAFGNAGFEAFFPATGAGHAALFADQLTNAGGVFQGGIAAAPGRGYTFTASVATEAAFDADLRLALEFYGADDATLVGASESPVSATGGAGYAIARVTGTAPAGAAFVRPVVSFDAVGGEGPDRAATIDDARLVEGIESTCRADIDGDGTANIFDILAYFDLFGAGDPRSDFTGDGSLDIFDVLAFFNEFASSGCSG